MVGMVKDLTVDGPPVEADIDEEEEDDEELETRSSSTGTISSTR